MRVDLFDFDLPQERIALRPADPRDSARLLVVDGGETEDRTVCELVQLVGPGDVLVINDTKVFPAELTGARAARDPSQNASSVSVVFSLHKQLTPNTWAAFARPAKRLRKGDILDFGEGLTARIDGPPEDGEISLIFNREGADLFTAFHCVGAPPLPPYISSKRRADDKDTDDYQTVFANEEGSVAAPTAGLHFTDELLEDLKARGVHFAKVTLHVGAGTFLPVKVHDTDEHQMHSEYGEINASSAKLINQVKREGGRVICVGTTSLRLLESAAEPDGTLKPFAAETDIFITPGYTFKIADLLMTNFHLPKSTLFMLVSAFAGFEEMQSAYKHAIDSGYRFYSYGDASLLTRNPSASKGQDK